MKELFASLTPVLVSFLVLILGIGATYLGKKASLVLNTKLKQDIARMTVEYVEQVGKKLGSEEKFALAKKKILDLATNAGITITDDELEVLIESVVNGFNQGYTVITEDAVAVNEPAANAKENKDEEEAK